MMARHGVVALLTAVLIAACGASTGPDGAPTPVPAASPAPSSNVGQAPSPSPQGGGPPAGPGPSADVEPLPEPSLTDGFAIGEALYDPSRQAEAVVSVLDLLRVGIYAADGTPIRPGAEQDADDLWLTDDEVRGLIAMGEADAIAMSGEEGAVPMTVADLHAALAPMLPEDFAAADFAAAYDEAYADHPDELLGQIMLGQPITPETPLTRAQAWLLFVDGFVAPTGLHARRPMLAARGPIAAPRGRPLAIGRVRMPTLSWMGSPWQATEMGMVLSHIYLIGYTIPFEIRPLAPQVHEGHGGQGPPLDLKAVYAYGNLTALASPMTGLPLILPRPTTLDGLTVTWGFSGVSALQKHGTVDVPPTLMDETDMFGAATMTFMPRREVADGRGEETMEVVSLEASVTIQELVLQIYDIPVEMFGMITGTRSVSGPVIVAWHTGGLKVDIENEYRDLQIVVGNGFAKGSGTDEASGFLALLDDGTYRGLLDASVSGSFTGAAVGTDCSDTFSGTQQLLAIGTPDILGQTVSLRFYPASPPALSTGSCTTAIPFPGGGPDFQPAGRFLPFNDTRWTTQIGFQIDVPATGTQRYTIPSLSGLQGTSTWTIEVERIEAGP
jgi:hypothetical protein